MCTDLGSRTNHSILFGCFVNLNQYTSEFVYQFCPLHSKKAIFIDVIVFYIPDRGCTSKQGWQPRGNYLDSGINQADDIYMTLRLPVKGFGNPEGLNNPRPGQYGAVEFVFEMICDGECTFKFKEVNNLN